jgi:hypothetical protein
MGTGVVVAVALAAGGIALAFYMDWLGLWVSDEEMKAKREAAKERMRLFRAEALGQHPAAIASAGPVPGAEASGKAFAFDVDEVSMGTLRAALPAWKFEVANGATPASLVRLGSAGPVDLVVVGLRDNVAESLGLCRFLAQSDSCAPGSRPETSRLGERPGDTAAGTRRPGAPLLVLTPPGQETLLEDALAVGPLRRLLLPLQAAEVTRLLAHPHAGSGPGRRSPNTPGAPRQDPWRDVGEG